MVENVGKQQKSEMKVLGSSGHSTYQWDKNNSVEVNAAREIFEKYVKEQGWSAFREIVKGEKGDRIEKFDPDAGRIILVPPISGGWLHNDFMQRK